MLDHLPGDRRHAAGTGDPLALDQLHRLFRLPPVHQHDLAAAHQRRDHHREAAGGVEERHDSSVRFCGAFGSGAGGRLAAAQERRACAERPTHDVRWSNCGGCRARPWACRSCRRCRRSSRRPRGRAPRRAAPGPATAPAIHVADDVFEPRDLADAAISSALAADIDALEIRAVVQMLEQRAPAARRRRWRSSRRNRSGHIPAPARSTRRSAASRSPPASRQPKKATGHSGRLRMMMATRSPFFTPACCSASAMASAAREMRHRSRARPVDDECLVAVARAKKQLAHGRRRVLPDARRHAADVALLDLEGRARRGQHRVGLRQRNSREFLYQQHGPCSVQ